MGGGWRYVTREEGGYEVGFHGEFRAIEAPHRIVSTEVFEGTPEPGAGALNTIVFDEQAGVTTMTINVLHTKKEHRDAHIESGIDGVQISMNRLEDIVVDLSEAA